MKELDYVINITHNGKPFYIHPTLLDENDIINQKNHYPDVGLYFLFNKGETVYIGASKHNIQLRLLDHIKDKEFDSYFIMTCIDNDRIVNHKILEKCLKNERKLIKIMKPKYNKLNNLALKMIS